jgi:hypothetical protein
MENTLNRALWITWYNLPADGKDAYLEWLHGSYIPMMLKRPGFNDAAHYASENLTSHHPLNRTTDAAVPAGDRYILIFGAGDPHVFARPVPGKLHAALPAADRKMLAVRQAERVNIMVDESQLDGPEAGKREGRAFAPCIQLGSFCCGTGDEEEMLDWYANGRMPSMQKLPGCIGVRKLVSVSGWAKHAIFYEFTSLAIRNEHFKTHEKDNPALGAWTNTFVLKLNHVPGSPNVARRIWPTVK